ncbi:MAG TPA: DUF4175 family protein [Flavobacterium sp.]
MESSNVIYGKLEAFIKKFYLNELLRGLIFFVGLGLLYFLFTLLLEYFLWLKPAGRTFLFWSFIAVETFLLVRYIMFPLFKLFKLRKGIDYKEASQIIGDHFQEVKDKLINFLQLSGTSHQSELLMASIEQKANALQPIPFTNAVNFKSNRKYLPIVAIPILFFAFFYISGNSEMISQSLNRVVNYKQQFLPPAPFRFIVLNDELRTEQSQDFLLRMKTEGNIVPENAVIFIGDESYFMESSSPGLFTFRVPKPAADVVFHVEANEVSSKDYTLAVVEVPSIANFEMQLQFPGYLNKRNESVKGTGNAIVPEGTQIVWRMKTLATDQVEWTDSNIKTRFTKNDDSFQLARRISETTDYQVITSNDKVADYEKLSYRISVVKDQHPSISVEAAPDSLKLGNVYVLGRVADDYGLSRLQIVFYPKDRPAAAKRGIMPVKKDIYDQFVFTFPGTLPVEQGVGYEYYFEVFDNDAPRGYKSSKSSVFSSRIQTDVEKEDQILQQQSENINSLEKSLKNQDKQINEMDKLQKMGKEKESLEFKDQQKVSEFLKRQQQQDEMMKEFSKKMEDNLEKFKTEEKDELKEELQKRLENADKDLEKNKKLLDELKELNEKIQNEELFEKMEKFKQTSKNQTKNLEQLVELTKKFYVEKKAEQIADKLEKLAEKQEALSDKEKDNTAPQQEEINKEFEKIEEELEELEKENKELKAPVDLPKDEEKQKKIDEDMKKATDELKKNSPAKAKPKQKSAAKQMMEMSAKMEASMAAGAMEQMEEDVKMLRQILDNLLAFSFSQEDLMGEFKDLKRGSPAFNKNLKIQQDLKQQFKHVDDSLFAMSLRNPRIAEDVTREIGNVHYNVDKSLESLVEAHISKGLSHQQYTISSANKLADFLSDILNSMQMSMSGSGEGKPKPGKGEGSGAQLPDIIKKQEGLGEKMKQGMKEGKKPGDGKKPGEGEKPGGKKPGEKGSGENGEGGENGNDGEGDAEAIMEIYKEQKQLREALQNELNKKGLGGNGQSAIDQMKQIEKQLLNKGFNNETLQRILKLKYELLKLEKAVQLQGEEKKRQAEVGKKQFKNNANALPAALQEYMNSIEILNRQTLPLRANYNQKVQEYFKNK